MLDDAVQPIAALNAERVVVYVNESARQWLGPDAADVVGQRSDWCWPNDPTSPASLAAQLCPPPDMFGGPPMLFAIPSSPASTSPPAAPNEADSRDGTPAPAASDSQWAVCFPLGDAAGPTGYLVIGMTEAQGEQLKQTLPVRGTTLDELHAALGRLRSPALAAEGIEHFLGTSRASQRIRRQVELAVGSSCDTLIVGPPGSGSRDLARWILDRRRAADERPGAIVDGKLMDAETIQTVLRGTLGSQHGLRRAAPAQRILLSDVDQMPSSGQLELREFLRLPNVQLSIIATAQRSLVELARQGEFDSHLADWLAVLVIELVPLVHRRSDIPLAAQAIVERINARGGHQLAGLDDEAIELVVEYSWPGDVEELVRTVEQACARATGPRITPANLPDELREAVRADTVGRKRVETINLGRFLADVERELLARALAEAAGNKSQAARLLGISRARLLRRVEQLNVVVPPRPTIGSNEAPVVPTEDEST